MPFLVTPVPTPGDSHCGDISAFQKFPCDKQYQGTVGTLPYSVGQRGGHLPILQ